MVEKFSTIVGAKLSTAESSVERTRRTIQDRIKISGSSPVADLASQNTRKIAAAATVDQPRAALRTLARNSPMKMKFTIIGPAMFLCPNTPRQLPASVG